MIHMMPDANAKHYWYHSDKCFNVTMSDNPPASWIPYVTCEHKKMQNGDIKKVFTRGDAKASMTIKAKDCKTPDTMRKIHNLVHKMLSDGIKESKSYLENERDKYCGRKQSDKLIEKLKTKGIKIGDNE